MKYDSNTIRLNRAVILIFAFLSLLISLGLLTSFQFKGDMLSRGTHIINNVSWEGLTFFETVTDSIKIHLLYTVATLLISGGYPSVVLPGLYIIFKAFSLGVTLGLAAKGCVLIKALSICLAVFVSNILVLPLYIIMFLISLRFVKKLRSAPNLSFGGLYFSFAGKVLLLFGAMCIAECIQSALGVLILNVLM